MRPAEMPAVVVIGSNGQLGSDLVKQFNSDEHHLVRLTHTDIELCNHDQVAHTLKAIRPRVIVNTAAFHKVEACEADVDRAFQVNCIAVRNLALVADRLDARLLHISTDYVFDGESELAYPEGATPNPINVYGASKLAGEFFVRSLCRRHLIIRSSGLYGLAGSSGKGGNFVETMLRAGRERGTVSVVTDQMLSPTYTPDLAAMIWMLVVAEAQGVFHVTNSGSCSWYEFARAIFELSGMQVEVQPITSMATGTTVRRPRNSVLANARLVSEGFLLLGPWRKALARYLEATGARVPLSAGARDGQN